MKTEVGLVELKSVTKSYQLGETRVQALNSLNLVLRAGDFTGIIGASGSGKSTLLNLVGSIDNPDSGEVWFSGQRTDTMNEIEKCRLRNENIGFIFQSFNLIPVLNVFENIEMPLLIHPRLKSENRTELVRQALSDVDLEKFERHMPNKLSGGQRQRVAIARALVTRPQLVLADEPTANLDSKTAHKIIDLLSELNTKKRVTFLFCSHDEKLIGRVGRVIKIQDGVILE